MSEPTARIIAVLLVFGALTWLFNRLFKGAGISIFLIGSILLVGLTMFLPFPGLFVGLLLLGVIAFFEIKNRRDRTPYPGIEIYYEGGGIRRGLSALEVAILYNHSKSTLLIIALVEMLGKNLVQVNQGLKINVSDWITTKGHVLKPAERSEWRQSEAFSKNIILISYEDVLLEILDKNSDIGISDINIDLWIAYLNKNLPKKLEGYDLLATKNYYLEFVSHRILMIWNKPEERLANLSWLIFAYFDKNIIADRVLEYLVDLRPHWLPQEIDLVEFIQPFLAK